MKPVIAYFSAYFARRWAALMNAAAREQLLIGASVFRIISGLTVLYEYLGVYRQRHFLYGPNGFLDWEMFARMKSGLSLYAISASPLYFEIVFHLGALVALLWVMGWNTRWMTVLNLVFWRSLQERTEGLWDGGDNLMQLVLIYACFANVGAHFSIDAHAERARAIARPARRAALAIVHNAAMLAFAIQLSIVYGNAGLMKVRGETWQNGTAIYYAMRSVEFTWPGLSEVVYRHSYVVLFFSYCTVAFQLGFFFCVFLNRHTRRAIIVVSLAFHVGIMTFMGLATFGLFMMSVDLALLDDDEYRAFFRFIRFVSRHVRLRVLRLFSSERANPSSDRA